MNECGKKVSVECWDLNGKCIRPKGHKGRCSMFFRDNPDGPVDDGHDSGE